MPNEENNRNNESDDKYVRLTGPAIIGKDADGRITILCLDPMLNPDQKILTFQNPEIKLEDVDLIIEFEESSPENFDFQQTVKGFNFDSRVVLITPGTRDEMNPSHPGGTH